MTFISGPVGTLLIRFRVDTLGISGWSGSTDDGLVQVWLVRPTAEMFAVEYSPLMCDDATLKTLVTSDEKTIVPSNAIPLRGRVRLGLDSQRILSLYLDVASNGLMPRNDAYVRARLQVLAGSAGYDEERRSLERCLEAPSMQPATIRGVFRGYWRSRENKLFP